MLLPSSIVTCMIDVLKISYYRFYLFLLLLLTAVQWTLLTTLKLMELRMAFIMAMSIPF